MRVVVVEPPPKGASRLERGPITLGAFDWTDPDPVVTVVVKRTYSFAEGELTLAKEQRPLAVADAVTPGKGAFVSYPWDFAPHKPRADVLLVGTAHPPSRRPSTEIAVRLTVGALERSVTAIARTPSESVPLRERNLVNADGGRERVGAAGLDGVLVRKRSFLGDFDYGAYNVAPDGQRRDYLSPGEMVRLEGVSPKGDIEFALPADVPRVEVIFRGNMPRADLQIVADTLWIDAEAEIAVIVYRGMIGAPRPGSVARIHVLMAPPDDTRVWDELMRSAARGAFAISASPEGADTSPKGEEEVDAISEARFDLSVQELPPDPTLPLEAYAAISAELAEQINPRKEVLARNALDEGGWLLEERAWLETIANKAMDGDGTLAARYGELFVEAQDALAGPHEEDRTLADYAEISAALDVAEDLPRELERRGIRLAEWMRLDRRVKHAAAADPAIADELDRLLAEAAVRAEAERS